jgi:hypothetical protein
MTDSNGAAHALQRVEELEARAADLEAKTLAAIREMRELMVSQLMAFGGEVTHLSATVADLATEVRERLPARSRRKGA